MPAILYGLWFILMVGGYMLMMGGWHEILDFLDELEERRERKRNQKR